ncbi:MAG: hypothetical protein KDB88_02630 [Flavobacteriales bacterium]|nr:hypothetical protein [Flavobacteriales bacterium]
MRCQILLPLVMMASAMLPRPLQAQEWVGRLHDPTRSMDEVRNAFREQTLGQEGIKGKGQKAMERLLWYTNGRLDRNTGRTDLGAFERTFAELRERGPVGTTKSGLWMEFGPSAWNSTSYTPGNGRVNVVVADPSDAQTLYIGTPSSGVWKSSNYGQDWVPLFDDLAAVGVTGIAVDPMNSGVLYASTGDGFGGDTYSLGVVKSADGGATWTITGLSWSTHQVRTTRRLLMHPADPNMLFCAANNGLWRSTDGASSWERVAEGSFYDVEFKPDDPTIVHACGTAYFRSTDGGATFQSGAPGLPPDVQVERMHLAVSAADPQMVYALCGRSDNNGFRGLYRSTDGGLTFTTRSTTPNIFGYQQSGSDVGGQCWYDMALAVDPVDPDILYAGGINVWKSSNGGSTWQVKSFWYWPATNWGYTHADIHALEVINGSLFCGSDGGLYRSDTGANSWIDLSADLSIGQCYRLAVDLLNNDRVLVGTQDNGSDLLENGTRTHVLGSDGMEAIVDPSDDQILFACQQNGGIFRSLDGGQTFGPVSNSISEEAGWVMPYVMHPNDPLTLFAGYRNLWMTTDRGDTWAQFTFFNPQVPVTHLAISSSQPDIMVYGNRAWTRRSTDGGATWSFIGPGLPDLDITAVAIDPNDPAVIWVGLSGFLEGHKVYMSTDTGNTWVDRSSGLPNLPINTLALTGGNNGIYVGTDLGVWYTDDQLSTWQEFSGGLPRIMVTELELDTAEQTIYAATYGRGIWRSPFYTAPNSPPVAAIGHGITELCGPGTVSFNDLSQGAYPSWDWQFPGGIPTSSTDAAPVVAYAADGQYTATLTVGNAYGQDMISVPIDVTVMNAELEMQLVFDNYPGETSWSIHQANGGALVASGGPYAGSSAASSITVPICLPHGCYTLTMHDAFGDGMCCDVGNGNYVLMHVGQALLASGGDFDAEESTGFCLDLGVSVDDAAANVTIRTLSNDGLYAVELAPTFIGKARTIDLLGRELRTYRPENGRLLVDLRPHPAGCYMLLLGQNAVRLIRP